MKKPLPAEYFVQYSRLSTKSKQDIAPIPDCVNPERRMFAEVSLKAFADTYFPNRFFLPWSPAHLSVIAKLDQAGATGGLFALAMPRGSGKTSLCLVAAIYEALIGRQQYIYLVTVSDDRSSDLIEDIKIELYTNPLLYEDYPEVCYPIRQLENRANRCKGQHCGGIQTHIKWGAHQIVLPFIQGSESSSTVIEGAGITSGSIRGPRYTRPFDGKTVRPSYCLIDDPQDDEVARSAKQVADRLGVINGSILGMAGLEKPIAAVCTCTVIETDDLASRILNRQYAPLWSGMTFQLLPKFPTRMDLWEHYWTLRSDSYRADGQGEEATEFYRANQAEMDAGAEIMWAERKYDNELSAIQHAMNLYFRDKRVFASEFQNVPERDVSHLGFTRKVILGKIVDIARGILPQLSTRLTAFVDVQKSALYWVVASWDENFGGHVVAYGTWPDQARDYYTTQDIQRTLLRKYPGVGLEGAIFKGLSDLTEYLFSRKWSKEDGSELQIEKLLIDANWGESTDTVYSWCRQSKLRSIILPSHGKGLSASSLPWEMYKKKPGGQLGEHWEIPPATTSKAIRHVSMDVNYWKSFLSSAISRGQGDRGSLTLHAGDHALFIDHLLAEYAIETTGRGRTVMEWRLNPDKPDNHWWDCLVGAAVGASLLGASRQAERKEKLPPVKWSEIQRQKREARDRA